MQRIVDRIEELAANPRQRGFKKLQGGGGFRIRVGDYRVLYDVIDSDRRVVVFAVGHRRDVYK